MIKIIIGFYKFVFKILWYSLLLIPIVILFGLFISAITVIPSFFIFFLLFGAICILPIIFVAGFVKAMLS